MITPPVLVSKRFEENNIKNWGRWVDLGMEDGVNARAPLDIVTRYSTFNTIDIIDLIINWIPYNINP